MPRQVLGDGELGQRIGLHAGREAHLPRLGHVPTRREPSDPIAGCESLGEGADAQDVGLAVAEGTERTGTRILIEELGVDAIFDDRHPVLDTDLHQAPPVHLGDRGTKRIVGRRHRDEGARLEPAEDRLHPLGLEPLFGAGGEFDDLEAE